MLLQRTQRNIQIAHSSSSDKWTVLALDLPMLLAPVASAAFEETKAIQFCANMLVRGAFTADDGYTQQVSTNYKTKPMPCMPISCTVTLVCVCWLQMSNVPAFFKSAEPNSIEPEQVTRDWAIQARKKTGSMEAYSSMAGSLLLSLLGCRLCQRTWCCRMLCRLRMSAGYGSLTHP